jgi:hypothetical protein
MKWIVLAAGICAIVFGSWWGWVSWTIVELERGWSGMIAGTIVASAGALLLGLSALMGRVDALLKAMRGMSSAEFHGQGDRSKAGLKPGALAQNNSLQAQEASVRPGAPAAADIQEGNPGVEIVGKSGHSEPPVSAPASVAEAARPSQSPGLVAPGLVAPGLVAGVGAGTAAIAGVTAAASASSRSASEDIQAAVAAALEGKQEETNESSKLGNPVSLPSTAIDEKILNLPANKGEHVGLDAGTVLENNSVNAEHVNLSEPEGGQNLTIVPPPRRIPAKLDEWPEPPAADASNDAADAMSGRDNLEADDETTAGPVADGRELLLQQEAEPDDGGAGIAPEAQEISEQPAMPAAAAIAASTAPVAAMADIHDDASEADVPEADVPEAGKSAAPDTTEDGANSLARPLAYADGQEDVAEGDATLEDKAGEETATVPDASQEDLVANTDAAAVETASAVTRDLPVDEAEAPAEPEEKPPLLRSYESQGITYFLYTDGSIEAQTPGGLLRFASLQELRGYIEQSKA